VEEKSGHISLRVANPAAQMAERYFNLKRWTPMKAGDHFAPSEEPEQLVNDIRMFYRSLR
jgi:hypothetical protein